MNSPCVSRSNLEQPISLLSRLGRLCLVAVLLATLLPSGSAQVSVWTQHNDTARTGANTNETVLTPSNVNQSTFGRLFTHPVDGYVYAQPLYVPNVAIAGEGTHNVLFVATQHNSVYAFDADSASGANSSPLWQASFISPPGTNTVPNGDVGSGDIVPEIGITSTPAIDTNTGTLYVEVKTKENGTYRHRLHALDITSGAEKLGGPVRIQATVNGTGADSAGGRVAFNDLKHMCRPGLLLLNGVVYAAYASHGDQNPYHGWLLGYDAQTLQQVGVYNTSPNGYWSGIWQSGNGPAADGNGDIYFETGNARGGDNVATNFVDPNSYTLCESFVKVATTNSSPTNNLIMTDYFTPCNQGTLNNGDTDLGSGGNLVLPDSVGSAAHPHLLVGCGKEGKIYLLDRDNMGRYNSVNDNQIVQSLPGAVGGTWSSPAFFNNQIYYQGSGDVMKAFRFSNGLLVAAPASRSTTPFGYPGATPSISANGTSAGIAWALQTDGYGSSGPAILHAYSAANLATELYNSGQTGVRDRLGVGVKYTVPTIANGKVYVGSQYSVSAFGLASGWTAAPTISPNGGVFTNSAAVTISTTTAGAAIYYTLDGSVPTTASTLYAGPFTITNSGAVKTFATKSGLVDSAVVVVTFLNSSVVGRGTGLTGHYWTTQLRTTNGTPTLVRVDATVNFDWGNGSPDPSISVDQFTALWTGQVQPEFNETYTFYTYTDDGVRLWVNNQLIINQWVDQGPTEWTGTATNLAAGRRYDIKMAYYENGGGAVAQLSWSSPSTAKAIIPQSQLYPTNDLPPSVTLTSPTNGTSFSSGTNINLKASASDVDGSVSQVQFLAGTNVLGTVAGGPSYNFLWTGVAAGNYTLTAKATDDQGISTVSAPVSISVVAGVPPNPTASLSGTNVVISWPDSPTTYVLQVTTNLSAPIFWSPSPEAQVKAGGRVTVTIDPITNERFYRLSP